MYYGEHEQQPQQQQQQQLQTDPVIKQEEPESVAEGVITGRSVALLDAVSPRRQRVLTGYFKPNSISRI